MVDYLRVATYSSSSRLFLDEAAFVGEAGSDVYVIGGSAFAAADGFAVTDLFS